MLQAHVFAPLKKVDDDAKAKTKGKAASAVPSVVDEAVVMERHRDGSDGPGGLRGWTFLAKGRADPVRGHGVVTLPSSSSPLAINLRQLELQKVRAIRSKNTMI